MERAILLPALGVACLSPDIAESSLAWWSASCCRTLGLGKTLWLCLSPWVEIWALKQSSAELLIPCSCAVSFLKIILKLENPVLKDLLDIRLKLKNCCAPFFFYSCQGHSALEDFISDCSIKVSAGTKKLICNKSVSSDCPGAGCHFLRCTSSLGQSNLDFFPLVFLLVDTSI